MSRFIALDVAFELAEALAPHLRTIHRADTKLADQLRRASISVVSCLAEGSRRIGRDRNHLFRTAEGSAAEVHAQLRMAATYGMVPAAALANAIALADRTTALCFALSRDAAKGYRQRSTTEEAASEGDSAPDALGE